MPQETERRHRATFPQATQVERLDSHTYRINLHSDYCIGAVPNGGYTSSCMLAAANTHLASRGQSDTVTAHFEYPNRTSSGLAIVVIDEVKLGRTLSTLHLTLWQGDLLNHAPWVNTSASRRTVLAYTTHTNWSDFKGMSVLTGYEVTPAALMPQKPDFKDLKANGSDDAWTQSIWPEAFGPAGSSGNWRFFIPRQGPLSPGMLDMWICLSNGENITQQALPYVVDAFPHDLLSFMIAPEIRALMEAPPAGVVDDAATAEARADVARKNKERGSMWFPTVLLNLETKGALTQDGAEWLAVKVTGKQIRDGKFDLEVVVRDVDGQVVMLAHQVALMVSWERNVGKKGGKNRAAL